MHLISPVKITILILFQQLWLLKLDWDDTLPVHIVEKWKLVRNELQELENIAIPRHIFELLLSYMVFVSSRTEPHSFIN